VYHRRCAKLTEVERDGGDVPLVAGRQKAVSWIENDGGDVPVVPRRRKIVSWYENDSGDVRVVAGRQKAVCWIEDDDDEWLDDVDDEYWTDNIEDIIESMKTIDSGGNIVASRRQEAVVEIENVESTDEMKYIDDDDEESVEVIVPLCCPSVSAIESPPVLSSNVMSALGTTGKTCRPPRLSLFSILFRFLPTEFFQPLIDRLEEKERKRRKKSSWRVWFTGNKSYKTT